MSEGNSVSFYINGKSYTISDVSPTQVLNSWLRSQPGLTGTKSMCYEGGCGSCMVALQRPSEAVKAVNSVRICFPFLRVCCFGFFNQYQIKSSLYLRKYTIFDTKKPVP